MKAFKNALTSISWLQVYYVKKFSQTLEPQTIMLESETASVANRTVGHAEMTALFFIILSYVTSKFVI